MDVFDIQALFPQLVLALGAALVGGNGLALWHERRGSRPAEAPPLRTGRAWFLMAIGLIMAAWGLATLIT